MHDDARFQEVCFVGVGSDRARLGLELQVGGARNARQVELGPVNDKSHRGGVAEPHDEWFGTGDGLCLAGLQGSLVERVSVVGACPYPTRSGGAQRQIERHADGDGCVAAGERDELHFRRRGQRPWRVRAGRRWAWVPERRDRRSANARPMTAARDRDAKADRGGGNRDRADRGERRASTAVLSAMVDGRDWLRSLVPHAGDGRALGNCSATPRWVESLCRSRRYR